MCKGMQQLPTILGVVGQQELNGRRRRFPTEADWAKGFVFGGKTKFKQCSFSDGRRLFLCEELCLVTVLLWHSKTSVICKFDDDGLIDDGEFIVLYDLNYSRLSLRRTAFVFVLKLNVYTDLEQLLTCSYAKFRLLKKIQCCCNVLP